jgi:hypothetical protein
MVMKYGTILAAAVIASTLASVPAVAQESDVCLREMYILSTKVHDSDTIVVTDRRRVQYTVNMTDTCVGLSISSQLINFHPKAGGMVCLRRGDEVRFSMPGDTRVEGLCLVDVIEEGAPS